MYTNYAVQPIRQLSSVLADIARDEHRLFSLGDLGGALPRLERGALTALAGRAVNAGVLKRVCHGLYCLPKAVPPGVVLYHAAARLRASHFNYLSLESVLSDAGVISQVPTNWITVMSSGRSHRVRCGDFGSIEFVHTKKRPNDIAAELTYDSRCHLWRASVALALRDMRAARRNLDLVNWERVHDPV